MDKGISTNSWLGGKYLLSNFKKERNDILKNSEVLRTFYKSFMGKDTITKTYYDTPDFFFKQNGINISINQIRRSSTAQLVVRYDSEKKRISFLKYMPDTYELKIKSNSVIADHLLFVEKAISELIINGLQVDVLEVLMDVQPIMIVKKRRDRWRMVGTNGLKFIASFDKSEYSSPLNPGITPKYDILEIVCENNPEQFDEAYQEQMKKIIRENPTIVQMQHSDLFIGYDSVLKTFINSLKA